MSSSAFSSILAANIDGRTQATRYRQGQLRKLHGVLVAHKDEILNTIITDSGNTSAEAEIEYLLAISELKTQFLSLNLKKSLDEEYSSARGSDCTQRRVGQIAFIAPTTYTQFYSVISPLSAALAAGNCVILEVSVIFQPN